MVQQQQKLHIDKALDRQNKQATLRIWYLVGAVDEEEKARLRRVLVPFDWVTAGGGDLSLSLLSRLPKPRVEASDLEGDRLFLPPPLARSVRLAVFTNTWARLVTVRTLRCTLLPKRSRKKITEKDARASGKLP